MEHRDISDGMYEHGRILAFSMLLFFQTQRFIEVFS